MVILQRSPEGDMLFCECGGHIVDLPDGSGYCQSCEAEFTAEEMKHPSVMEVS